MEQITPNQAIAQIICNLSFLLTDQAELMMTWAVINHLRSAAQELNRLADCLKAQ